MNSRFNGAEVSLVTALKDKFGGWDGQFSQEIADLTDTDREEIRQMLIADGYKVTSLIMIQGDQAANDPLYIDPPPEPIEMGYRVGQVHPTALMAK